MRYKQQGLFGQLKSLLKLEGREVKIVKKEECITGKWRPKAWTRVGLSPVLRGALRTEWQSEAEVGSRPREWLIMSFEWAQAALANRGPGIKSCPPPVYALPGSKGVLPFNGWEKLEEWRRIFADPWRCHGSHVSVSISTVLLANGRLQSRDVWSLYFSTWQSRVATAETLQLAKPKNTIEPFIEEVCQLLARFTVQHSYRTCW